MGNKLGKRLGKITLLSALLLSAAATFAADNKNKEGDEAPDIAALLGAEPAAEATDCVYARDVRTIEVLDERAIVLHGSHGRYWLNEFKHKCVGLRKNMILDLSRYGSQICANDRVRGREHGDIGPVASCRLGKFQPVALEQVTTLKAELTGR